MKIFEKNKIELQQLGKKLGCRFNNKKLIIQALTHRSLQKKDRNDQLVNNERLEFFGDAVLKLAVSEMLYKQFPDFSEGELTKVRANLVSDVILGQIARQIGLPAFVLLGPHEIKAGEANRTSILAGALEALIGAVYLDRGFAAVQKMVTKLLQEKMLGSVDFQKAGDYKSRLQEEVQKLGWSLPVYRVVREKGPEHQKVFFVEVMAGEKALVFSGLGRGQTKKTAEQFAARAALEKLIKRS